MAPLLAYKSQLVPLQSSFAHIESTGLLKAFHLATDSLSHKALFNLDVAGGPKIKSIRAQANAALMRAAARTLPQWPEWITAEGLGGTTLSIPRVLANSLANIGPPAFAWNLHEAWRGFPQDKVRSESGRLYVRHCTAT